MAKIRLSRDGEIRLATEGDISRLCELSEEGLGRDGWDVKMFRNSFESESDFCLVYEKDGEIICFANCQKSIDEICVLDIVTAKDYRKKGYATKLVKEVVKLAKESAVKQVYLEVSSQNNVALMLYDKFGFEPKSVRKNYYKDGTDALVMALEIAAH